MLGTSRDVLTCGTPTANWSDSDRDGPMIYRLHLQCLDLLDLVIDCAAEQKLSGTKASLKLWGSGLFGQCSLVSLDSLGEDILDAGVAQFIMGTLGGILSILGIITRLFAQVIRLTDVF